MLDKVERERCPGEVKWEQRSFDFNFVGLRFFYRFYQLVRSNFPTGQMTITNQMLPDHQKRNDFSRKIVRHLPSSGISAIADADVKLAMFSTDNPDKYAMDVFQMAAQINCPRTCQ